MRIVDLLKKESIELKAKADSKAQAIDKLIALQAAGGAISDEEEYRWTAVRENYPQAER